MIFWVTHYFFAGRKTLGICRNTHLFISWLLILHLLLPSDSTLNTQTDSIADDRGLLIASKYSQDLHTNIFLKWNISNQLKFSLLRSTRISLDNISVGHSFCKLKYDWIMKNSFFTTNTFKRVRDLVWGERDLKGPKHDSHMFN